MQRIFSYKIPAIIFIIIAILFFGGTFVKPKKQIHADILPDINLTNSDRILILAPHPDDEILSSAGIIQKAVTGNIPIKIVFLTFGDFNEWSFAISEKHPVLNPKAIMKNAEIRHNEAIAASASLGLNHTNLIFLGYPDGGTMKIWENHWKGQKPFRQILTKANAVPYKNAFHPGSAYIADNIISDLRTIINEFKPTKVIVSHPFDFHPDHRAFYLYANVAIWESDLKHEPVIYSYLTHYRNWPVPSGLFPDLPLQPPKKISEESGWVQYPLTEEQREKMLFALNKHKTQMTVSKKYLSSFVRSNHLFQLRKPLLITGNSISNKISVPLLNNITDENMGYLTEPQKKTIIGTESLKIYRDKENLYAEFLFKKPVADLTGLSFYLFGYRTDTRFGNMPKLHIKIESKNHVVYDKNRKIENKITLVRKKNMIVIKIPLVTLSLPENIFLGYRNYLKVIPVNKQTWQIIKLH